ncbi:MAG: phosphate ABC transporter substrate-binding protein PstS family protein [Acidimicrobiia bacterium]|nr:phosphate ABC transporter substrate-binding protein PstS family protein [Acidimicrobiia bacterium]
MKARRFTMLVLALTLTAASCGGDDDATDDTTDEGTTDTSTSGAPGDASGSIAISGSSTVEPISALVAQRYSDANPGVAITVDGPGTGDGFQLFCSGETDISDASRAIDDEEAALCADSGIEYVELQVGIDGLSVLTNTANSAVTCLNFGDLYALSGPESIGFDNWSDANELAAEVGGSGGLPDAPLSITAPGEESGTYDTYVELVLEDIARERGQDPVARPDYTASPNDNVIVEGIQGSDTAFGWVGYAFYTANQDVLKAIEIDGGDGCVAPTPETIVDGSYPLSRPLFIYVNSARMAENQQLAGFVEYYFSEEGITAVADAGYVSLTSYDDQRAAIGG